MPNSVFVTLADGDTLGGRLVRVVLGIKRVRWHAGNRPTSHRTLSLQDGLVTLEGVLSILFHIERTYRRVPLLSEAPAERARSIRLLEQALSVLDSSHGGANSDIHTHRGRLGHALATIERTLAELPDRRTSAFAVRTQRVPGRAGDRRARARGQSSRCRARLVSLRASRADRHRSAARGARRLQAQQARLRRSHAAGIARRVSAQGHDDARSDDSKAALSRDHRLVAGGRGGILLDGRPQAARAHVRDRSRVRQSCDPHARAPARGAAR